MTEGNTVRVDLRHVEAFAELRHMEFETRGGGRLHAEPAAVGRLAEEYARRLYFRKFGNGVARSIVFARCAGCLVYAMECYGCNFEDVCRESDLGVAKVVAGLSVDPRQSRPRRNLELRTRLSQGEILSQLVRLAEITISAQKVLDNFTRDDYREDPVVLKDWVGDNYELLKAMHRLIDRKAFRRPFERAFDLLEQIDTLLDEARGRSRRSRAKSAEGIEAAFTTDLVSADGINGEGASLDGVVAAGQTAAEEVAVVPDESPAPADPPADVLPFTPPAREVPVSQPVPLLAAVAL